MRPEAGLIVRLTAAAIIAYQLTRLVDSHTIDLTGALTALLVVRTSVYQTLRSGVGRIAAVLSGVLLAIGVGSFVGIEWWSLGIVIAAALALAHGLKLGDNLLEAPISAMLILGAHSDVAGGTRVLYTLIGAAVGVLFTLVFPARVPISDAGAAVRRVSETAAEILRRAGIEMSEGLTRPQVGVWLDEIHAALPLVGDADQALTAADESRKLNPRALTVDNPVPVLRTGLRAMDRAVLAVRHLLLALQQEAPEHVSEDGTQDAELRNAFAVVVLDIADVLRAFGNLVDAEGKGREAAALDAMSETLEVLRETRAIVTELLMVHAAEDSSGWLLRGSVLTAVEGVLDALDVEQRARTVRETRKEQERLNELPVMTRLGLGRDPWTRLDEG